MICGNIKKMLRKQLIGQYIIDIYHNDLSKEFQSINEYDSIDISFLTNSILRVQCTLRILFQDDLIFLSNNRFIDDETNMLKEKKETFDCQVQKISIATINSQITEVLFTKLGDMKLITNNGYEIQVIIDTRRSDCTSYDIWDFDSQTNICVFFETGQILGAQKGGYQFCN